MIDRMGYLRFWPAWLCVLACCAAAPQTAPADWGQLVDRGLVKPPFDMPAIVEPTFAPRDFVITDDGAVAGQDAPVTAAIEKAVAACSAGGGGRVVIPAGTWKTGPIHLRSNVNLYLSKDAVLSFSDTPEDYLPPVLVRWEGMDCYNYSPLIYARDCTNVAVTGPGKLLGNGNKWWSWAKHGGKSTAEKLYQMVLKNTPVEQRVFGTPGLRPTFVEFNNCQRVLLADFTIVDGPFWTIHPVYCQDVTVRGLTITTDGPNTDGVNPDSCKNVLIEHCNLATGDDCVTLKSGLNEDGWRVNKPDENIIVQYCHMTAGHGGVSIGSEMSGGVQNVFVHDCAFEDTATGIRIKSMRGRGSYVRNVTVRNVRMRNIKTEAIDVTTFYGASSTVAPSTVVPPVFGDFLFANITCDGARQSVALEGLPEKPLGRITLEHCVFHAKKLMTRQDAGDVVITDVQDQVVK